jgi:hypothetical protein
MSFYIFRRDYLSFSLVTPFDLSITFSLYYDHILVLSSPMGYLIAMYNEPKTLSTIFAVANMYAPATGPINMRGKYI